MADPFRIFRQKTVHLQHLGGGFAQHQMKTEIHLFHLSLFQRFCIRLIQQQGEGFQDDWGNLLRYTIRAGIRHNMAAHPFALDQLGPQWGSRGILQLRQSLLSSRFALTLFCIHKLEQQFAVCFILAQLQNGLFSLYALGRQLF